MTEALRKQRNEQKLLELYPTFRKRLAKVIADLEKRGLRPRIQDAWRSPQDQLTAFNTGHSKLKYGFHNVTGANGEKESLAVDLLDDDSPLASKKSYLLQLADAAAKQGLNTGIRWGVPAALVGAIDTAIKNKAWDANVKIGWDPTHVEPVGITPAEAKSGKRPK
jgi:hypothetical protein